jgi:hypothetical protein
MAARKPEILLDFDGFCQSPFLASVEGLSCERPERPLRPLFRSPRVDRSAVRTGAGRFEQRQAPVERRAAEHSGGTPGASVGL